MDLISVIGDLLMIVVAVAGAIMFSEMIEAMLRKDRMWLSFLLLVLGIMLAETALYSWIPGRFGRYVELFEGAFTLEDGSVLSNLGGILAAQGVAILFALAKQAWDGIRKRGFSWKLFLLETLFSALFIAGGAVLYQNEGAIAVTKDETARTLLLLAFSIGGAVMVFLGIRGLRKAKRER